MRDSGVQVDIANNGREGVEKAQAKYYNLIRMDIQMPEMDGYQTPKTILALNRENR